MIGKRESNKINNNIEMSASVRKTTTHSALIDSKVSQTQTPG